MSNLEPTFGELNPSEAFDIPADTAVLRSLAEYYNQAMPADLYGPQTPPVLTSMLPNTMVINTQTLVTITGTNFHHNVQVYVDGVAHQTTYVSATQVKFLTIASGAGTQTITAKNGPSAASGSLTMTVTLTLQEEPQNAAKQQPSPPPSS